MSTLLIRSTSHLYQQVRNGSSRTCMVKIGREKYCRMYPTTIVNSDGSSYTIRYHEPIRIINLPMDTSELNEQELKQHVNRRKLKEKIVIVDQLEDDGFDVNRYSHLWKSKPKDK
ncbi:hypothetical protein JTE90_024595 [Oedothorax gibbosus]|uniref:39S ribosomal protein L55, mitochondrial n=1 Tax=Oedothorax gibbosus TaxID=931172 RepID=A0AAV6VCM2_9ARAC|nr:hypothetical protein JTE90_024595 [Oedothorax gibbosus]